MSLAAPSSIGPQALVRWFDAKEAFRAVVEVGSGPALDEAEVSAVLRGARNDKKEQRTDDYRVETAADSWHAAPAEIAVSGIRVGRAMARRCARAESPHA